MRTPALLAALGALLAPAAAAGELPPVDVGARVGFAAAFGDAAGGTAMRALTVEAQVPVQLEASLRVGRDLAAGPYLSYGVGRVDGAAVSGACEIAGVTCSGHAWRAGAQARWTFSGVEAAVVPWVGAALGWEWGSVEARDATGRSTVDVNGWEVGLQAGGDWRVASRVVVGPYLQLALGRYQGARVTVDGADAGGGTLAEKATHGWFGLGVAGRFEL